MYLEIILLKWAGNPCKVWKLNIPTYSYISQGQSVNIYQVPLWQNYVANDSQAPCINQAINSHNIG